MKTFIISCLNKSLESTNIFFICWSDIQPQIINKPTFFELQVLQNRHFILPNNTSISSSYLRSLVKPDSNLTIITRKCVNTKGRFYVSITKKTVLITKLENTNMHEDILWVSDLYANVSSTSVDRNSAPQYFIYTRKERAHFYLWMYRISEKS